MRKKKISLISPFFSVGTNRSSPPSSPPNAQDSLPAFPLGDQSSKTTSSPLTWGGNSQVLLCARGLVSQEMLSESTCARSRTSDASLLPEALPHFLTAFSKPCGLKMYKHLQIQTTQQTTTITTTTKERKGTSGFLNAKRGSRYTALLSCPSASQPTFPLAIPSSVLQNPGLGTKQTQDKASKKHLLFQRGKIKQKEPNFLNWGGEEAILAASSFQPASNPQIYYLAASKPAITQDKKWSGFHSCLLLLPTCER